MGWNDSGNYHWCDWSVNDSDYDYYVRLASNTYSDSRCYPFDVRSSLPNVSQPSGSEEYCVVNGSIGSATPYGSGTAGYNVGGQVTLYSYNAQQYNWGNTPRDKSYLVMYTWGAGNMYFTTASSMDAGSADITLGCPAKSDGTGESGCSATTSHCFIGSNGTTNYFGYSTGKSGADTVSFMTSKYGGTCAILDGGGSTYCRYQGSVKKNTDGRYMYNALAVYRKKKSSPTPTTKYTISTSVSPSGSGSVSGGGTYSSGASCTLTAAANSGYTFKNWNDGNTSSSRTITVTGNATYTAYFEASADLIDNRRMGAVAGTSYVLKNGSLKKAQPWYVYKDNVLKSRPKGIYTLVDGSLKPLILKYNVSFNSNGGSSVTAKNYYWGESISSLDTPTHGSYDSRACIFDGWFRENAFLNKVSGIGTDATGDRTYHAKWIQSKTQYSGTYTVNGTVNVYFNKGKSGPYSWSNRYNKYIYWSSKRYDATLSGNKTITHVEADIDHCNLNWTNYTSPRVDYGYYTSDSISGWNRIGTLCEEGEGYGSVNCNFNLPSGAWVGFYSVSTNGDTAVNGGYLNSASFSYTDTVTKTADWQDDSNPPESGTWSSGSPQTRTVTRYYNGSSWTSWST